MIEHIKVISVNKAEEESETKGDVIKWLWGTQCKPPRKKEGLGLFQREKKKAKIMWLFIFPLDPEDKLQLPHQISSERTNTNIFQLHCHKQKLLFTPKAITMINNTAHTKIRI